MRLQIVPNHPVIFYRRSVFRSEAGQETVEQTATVFLAGRFPIVELHPMQFRGAVGERQPL